MFTNFSRGVLTTSTLILTFISFFNINVQAQPLTINDVLTDTVNCDFNFQNGIVCTFDLVEPVEPYNDVQVNIYSNNLDLDILNYGSCLISEVTINQLICSLSAEISDGLHDIYLYVPNQVETPIPVGQLTIENPLLSRNDILSGSCIVDLINPEYSYSETLDVSYISGGEIVSDYVSCKLLISPEADYDPSLFSFIGLGGEEAQAFDCEIKNNEINCLFEKSDASDEALISLWYLDFLVTSEIGNIDSLTNTIYNVAGLDFNILTSNQENESVTIQDEPQSTNNEVFGLVRTGGMD